MISEYVGGDVGPGLGAELQRWWIEFGKQGDLLMPVLWRGGGVVRKPAFRGY